MTVKIKIRQSCIRGFLPLSLMTLAVLCSGCVRGCSRNESDSVGITRKITSGERKGYFSPTNGRNILFVTIDTLRADHLGCYGYENSRSPVIDRLAAGSVLFSRALAHSPITAPSHAALFTSHYPFQLGLLNNSEVLKPRREKTLAEVLAASGYRTAGFVSLEVLNSFSGFGRGFEFYSGVTAPPYWKTADQVNEEVFAWLDGHLREPFFLWVHYSDPHEPYHSPDVPYRTITVTKEHGLNRQIIGSAHCDRLNRIPLVLEPGTHLITFAPGAPIEGNDGSSAGALTGEGLGIQFRHTEILAGDPMSWRWKTGWSDKMEAFHRSWRTLPGREGTIVVENNSSTDRTAVLQFLPVENLDLATIVERYDREIAYVDSCFGALLSRFEELQLAESTIVILTSDHGEGLGERGLIGHIEHLYQNLIHVPLIIHLPGATDGQVVDSCVRHIDIYPTVLDLLDIPLPTSIAGRNLSPLFRGKKIRLSLPGKDPFREGSSFAETHPPEASRTLYAVVRDGWKLIVDPHTGSKELYMIGEDPGEGENLAGTNSLVEAELTGILASVIGDIPRDPKCERRRLTKIREALESLGYVGGTVNK